MRTINATALAELQREFGLEPILVVRVFWNDSTHVDYSDKREGLEDTGVQGKILEISGINDVVSLDSGGNSISVDVTLDDSDGSIRDIINTIDVHKRRVQILQWFADVPLSEAFVIFTGQINTPMEWSEGQRTFKFSVLNLLENYELGFSMEEGFFDNLPVHIAGKAFPLVFGTALQVPSLMIADPPSGVIAEGFALVYEDVYQAELDSLSQSISDANKQSEFLYQAGIGASFLAAGYNDGLPDPPDDFSTYLSLNQASQQFFQQSEQFKLQALDLRDKFDALTKDLDDKKKLAKTTVKIAALNFNLPAGVVLGQKDHYVIEINGTRLEARFTPPIMTIIKEDVFTNDRPTTPFFQGFATTPNVAKITQTSKSKTKFKWFDAGTRIRILDVPMSFIACFGGLSKVTGVWAKAKGAKVIVPPSYYTAGTVHFTNDRGFTASAQMVTLNVPLTSIVDASGQNIYDSDELWCDIVGEVGNNFVDIVQYALLLFSTLTPDPASFALVRGQVAANPMNFVIQDRKNTLDFIKELAFQAKCAVWVNDRTVHLRYLSAEPNSVGTITPDDIIEDSLVLTSTDTEEVVTKIVATWKSTYDQETSNRLITRYNIARYGVIEEDVDYYAFNLGTLVQRSAAFWAIRKGTVWKRVTFKTFIDKLIYETNDVITLSGFEDFFSCADVKGVILSQSYDSSENTVTFDVWLPIRWGERCQTPYAYPSDQITIFGAPNVPEFASGNPFQNVVDSGQFDEARKASFQGLGPRPPISTQPFNMQDVFPGVEPNTAIAYVPINPVRPDGLENANDRQDVELLTPATVSTDDGSSGNASIGTVTGQSEGGIFYDVTLLTGSKITAKQLKIAEGFKVALLTPVVVVKVKGQWYMQAPIWSKEPVSE